MKKILLFTVLLVFGYTANAQDDDNSDSGATSQGKWMFGADAGLAFTSSKSTPEFDGDELDFESKTSIISFTPSANYFVIDDLAVGLDLGIISTKETEEFDGDSEDYTTTAFSVIPNATYFFGGDNLRPYVGAGVGLMSVSGEDDEDKFSGLAIKGQGGIAYFFNQSVALNIGLEFVSSNMKNKEESDYVEKLTAFGIGVGFSVFF